MGEQSNNGGVGLSPPDVTYYNLLKYSVGDDKHVKVAPYVQVSDALAVVTLYVKGASKARALATLLNQNVTIGNIQIIVTIATSSGITVEPILEPLTPRQIERLFRTAFDSNKLYKFVALKELFGNVFVYPVFKDAVIQFYNDDLSDYYSNYNNVAAFVFREVLKKEISGTVIQYSTKKK